MIEKQKELSKKADICNLQSEEIYLLSVEVDNEVNAEQLRRLAAYKSKLQN